MNLIAARGLVEGKVQGVGFRYHVRTYALKSLVQGSATNLPDGSVRVILQGTTSAVEEMKRRVEEGPAFSRVGSVKWEEIPVSSLSGFVIG